MRILVDAVSWEDSESIKNTLEKALVESPEVFVQTIGFSKNASALITVTITDAPKEKWRRESIISVIDGTLGRHGYRFWQLASAL